MAFILAYHAVSRAPGGTTIRGEGSTTRQVSDNAEFNLHNGANGAGLQRRSVAPAYREKCVTGRSSRCPPMVTSTFSL